MEGSNNQNIEWQWLTRGISVGFTFGYTLQRTGITKHSRVSGMLLLKDFKKNF